MTPGTCSSTPHTHYSTVSTILSSPPFLWRIISSHDSRHSSGHRVAVASRTQCSRLLVQPHHLLIVPPQRELRICPRPQLVPPQRESPWRSHHLAVRQRGVDCQSKHQNESVEHNSSGHCLAGRVLDQPGLVEQQVRAPLTIVVVHRCAIDKLLATRLARRRWGEDHRETTRSCGQPMQRSTIGQAHADLHRVDSRLSETPEPLDCCVCFACSPNGRVHSCAYQTAGFCTVITRTHSVTRPHQRHTASF